MSEKFCYMLKNLVQLFFKLDTDIIFAENELLPDDDGSRGIIYYSL